MNSVQPPASTSLPTVFRRLIAIQIRRPALLLLLAVVLTAPAVYLARSLELRTGFESLLPENKASVIEMKRVAEHTAGVSTLAIVMDGKDKQALQKFGEALLPPLRAMGPEWVGTAEVGIHAERDFLKQRQALYVPVEKLRDLADKVERHFGREVFGGLDDDDEKTDDLSKESIEKELGASNQSQSKGPAYVDGYYMNEAATRLIVLVRTPIPPGDLPRSFELQRRAREVIARVNPQAFHPSITAGLTGDIVTSAEQYNVVKNDLATVGIAGITMILLVDFLFFLRLRAVFAMAIAISIGVLWTFGVTRFTIGHLNTASGFLVSIIFGNGINFGILLRARYGEARRAGESLEESIAVAYRDTFRPTLTVAAAAGVGYLSLATTSFRGFRDFGLIGGYGMLLCWAANYLFMPPLLVLFERFAPTWQKQSGNGLWARFNRIADHGIPFGAPFAWVARHVPSRWLAGAGVAALVAGVVACVSYVRHDPLEYFLGNLENDAKAVESAATRLGSDLTDITGRSGQDGMAILTQRIDQVKPLLKELEKARDAVSNPAPFEKVVSIYDFVPDDQEEKLTLLAKIRRRLNRAHESNGIKDDDWKSILEYLPAPDLKPFGISDLPERVARPFTERDGTRGRIVYVVPTEGQSVRNLHYLLRWADAYRKTTLPNGDVIFGSGRAVIFSDMLESVIEEAPKAVVLSALMTVLVVIVAFYRGRRGLAATLLVIGSLLAGMVWMGSVLYLLKVKINFLNFIAIPITLGIGVDYAINLVHRWRIQPSIPIWDLVRETGGAVVLCSMTTSLGYLALLQSVNPAVRSFGLAAVIGEMTCLLTVVVVLPAILQSLRLSRASTD